LFFGILTVVPQIVPVSLSSTSLSQGFWQRYQEELSTKGLAAQWKQIVDTGRLENFYRVARGESGTHVGIRFDDSDTYKWLEAAAYSLAHYPNEELLHHVDTAVEAIQAAQQPDGYLFTYVQLNFPDWKWRDLASMHEMYCVGHLCEAAVALKAELGQDALLEVAKKAVQNILDTFGPDKRHGYCGHPEIEIGLYRLSEITGDRRYQEFADWMIDQRGHRPSPFESDVLNNSDLFKDAPRLFNKKGAYHGAYGQDDLPIREQSEIVGHSVRAAYLYTAASWSASDRRDEELLQALNRIWDNLTLRRMYVTGGIGSTGENEGFTADYDLPNLHAYAETCAGIALAMWGRAMFQATGNGDYIEVMERAIFNGILSGISLDTTLYNYENPLESRSNHARQPWFHCACCPPNIARMIGSIAQYAIYEDVETSYIAFPIAGTYQLSGGLTLRIESDYPHSGSAKITVSAAKPIKRKLAIRIPDWSEEITIEFPGTDEPGDYVDGFVVFDFEWSKPESITVDFDMQPKFIESNPQLLENAGKVALQYGPSIYCVESFELSAAPQLVCIDAEEAPEQSETRALDGAPIWKVNGIRQELDFSDTLYDALGTSSQVPTEVTLVPYRVWNSNGPSYMNIWLRAD
jgi:uncharacterized protein